MTSGTVVVGGGSGFIGSYLSKLLSAKGYDVHIISRMPGIQRMTWTDLKEKGLPEPTTAVVNLAGQNVLDPSRRWTTGFKQNVWNSRVNTTTALANAINRAETTPTAFVTMSGVGIYKPCESTIYNESKETTEFDFLSKLCHTWEKSAVLLSDKACRVVNLRSGVVLGRNGGMIKQLYWPFYLGLGGPIGNGKQYLPWIHVIDLCRLILFSIEKSNVTGPMNAVAPDIVTNAKFTSVLADTMKRPAVFPVPAFVLDVIFNGERAKMMTQGQKVIPEKASNLGFNFLYPKIEDACRITIEGKETDNLEFA
ncbi:epimerase family protein SDR39U1 [Agrilus planipennis]|uniref:Epimerase family protein SDR39U1 n=1 Tax=Agrilus planipennis TaxID=224129 RepID=A0A1W4XUA1_AGRPL|nr:epimerase family protein SDR39U1 [Agrilus planipennis]